MNNIQIRFPRFLLVFTLLALSFIVPTVAQADTQELEITHEKGVVIAITEHLESPENIDTDLFINQDDSSYTVQELKIEVLSGDEKGKLITVENELRNDPLDILVKKDDKVILYGMRKNQDQEVSYSLEGKWHFSGIIYAGILFVFFVILLGGRKGIMALFSLALSILALFYVFIPLLEMNVNNVFITCLVALIVTLVTMPIILGFNKKSLIAILGSLFGVFAALFFGFVFKWLIDVNGMGAEDSRMLATQFPNFDYEGLFLAGVIIGALGAVMDVAVSITSGLDEVTSHSRSLSRREIWLSGIAIGKDLLGSMVNTLIFAYVGASLTLILLFMHSEASLRDVLNQSFIAEEIVRSLVGSMGLIATIPLTAFFGAHFFQGRTKSRNSNLVHRV